MSNYRRKELAKKNHCFTAFVKFFRHSLISARLFLPILILQCLHLLQDSR